MEDKHEVTVPMPGAMHDDIVDNLEYGDSKAGWIRGAIVGRLKLEGVDVSELDDDVLEDIDLEWTEAVEEDAEGNPNPATVTA